MKNISRTLLERFHLSLFDICRFVHYFSFLSGAFVQKSFPKIPQRKVYFISHFAMLVEKINLLPTLWLKQNFLIKQNCQQVLIYYLFLYKITLKSFYFLPDLIEISGDL